MITRNDYMEKRATHAEYYREIYKEAHISYKGSYLLPRIRQALASGDEHLNTIPLPEWDTRSEMSKQGLSRVLREHGDFYSLAGGVCAHKQAALDAAESEEE